MSSAPRPLGVRAVLFDLDGTLADTAADLAAALNRIRIERKLAPMALLELRPHASDGTRGMLGAGLGVGRDHPEFAALRDAFLDYYEAALCEHTTLFPGAAQVLEEIECRGLAWGIVTNKAARFTLPLLEALNLAQRAAIIVCGDTAAQPKPHPDPLLHAAAALGIDADACVYVGDAERDVLAARAARMASLVARYGYIAAEARPESWGADGFIDSLAAVLDWLPRSAARDGPGPV